MNHVLHCIKGEIHLPPKKVNQNNRAPRVPSGKKILQVFLNEEVHRRFKAYAAMHGVSMSEIVVNRIKGILQLNEANYSRPKYEGKK